jgi:hypothetical protein
MHGKTLPTLNKVIIKCTVHYIVHLQCTFSRSCTYESKEQRKMGQVLGTFGLLNFGMLRRVITWRAFLNL